MVIDMNHPLAPYCVVLRKGKPVGFVTRIDTHTMTLWRTGPELTGDTPGSQAVYEEKFDEVRYSPDLPTYLRVLLPKGWKPVTIIN